MIDILCQKFQIGIPAFAQLQNRHFVIEPEFFNQFGFQVRCQFVRKHFIKTVKVKRNIDFFAVYNSLNPVHKIVPVGKTAQIIPHFFISGMKHVRTVFMDGHAGRIFIIVNIAADMVPFVNHQHFFSKLRSYSFCQHHAGQTAADNQILYFAHFNTSCLFPIAMPI